ncbi:hypothetical protein PAMA_007573 [Pampus argenteus]
MRSWLLLASLLVSDLCPLGDGDGDWVMDYLSFCRKQILNGHLKRLLMLETHIEQCCMCIHRSCVYVVEQHIQRISPFCCDHGNRNHIPALVVSSSHRKGKSVAAFLVKSDVSIPAMHVINGAAPTVGEAMEMIKHRPAWLVHHHHTTASGRNFQAFLLEKSQIWTAATIVQPQEMLSKRQNAGTTVIISCLKEGQTRTATNIKEISKEPFAEPHMRPEESMQRAMDINVLDYGGRQSSTASVKQHDISHDATLNSGSSSGKFSDTSQMEINRNTASSMKTNERVNSLLQKSVQKQLSLKDIVENDGFYSVRQLSLVPGDKKKSMNRPQYKIRVAQGRNKDGKTITKHAELKRPEGESETGQSHTTDFTHKTQNNDAGYKQMFTQMEQEVLIRPLLGDTETQTKASSVIKLDTGWKTIDTPIKQLDDPLRTVKVIKAGSIIQPDNSKYYPYSLEIRPASKITTTAAAATTASAYTKENVKETTRTTEPPQTADVTGENMGINYTEQEENMPSEDSVTPSSPAHEAQTSAVNTEITQTTAIMEVFKNTEKIQTTTTSPEPETNVDEPAFIKYDTGNIQATRPKSYSGLRMREDIQEDATKLHEGIKDERRAHVSPAATNRPETERKEDQNDSFTFPKPLETSRDQAADHLLKTTDGTVPLCRGLIHRTEAGFKHCMERFAGKTITTTSGPSDTFQGGGVQEKRHASIRDDSSDDEDDHFYYFDGVLKRVQYNFYPYDKRQRRSKKEP